MDVIKHMGPGLLTRTVCRWLCCDGQGDKPCSWHNKNGESMNFNLSQVMAFEHDVFDPLPKHLRKDCASRLQEFVVPGLTVSAHLWGCSWQCRGEMHKDR